MPTKKKVVKKIPIKKSETEILRKEVRELKHDIEAIAGAMHYERGQRLDIKETVDRFARGVRRDINHVHERINKIDPEEQAILRDRPTVLKWQDGKETVIVPTETAESMLDKLKKHVAGRTV